MKVGLVSSFRYHFFEAARELKKQGLEVKLASGYFPKQIEAEGLASHEYLSHPLWTALVMGMARLGSRGKRQQWLEFQAHDRLDRFASGHLNDCDVVMAMHSTGLRTGTRAQARGAKFVLDRPVIHTRAQDELLSGVYESCGLPYTPISPLKIAKEEKEYQQCDLLLTPSRVAAKSYIERGIPAEKVAVLPLGADLSKFGPPEVEEQGPFEVLMAGNIGIQKGIHVLTEAVEKLGDPTLTVSLAGPALREAEPYFARLERACRLNLLGKLSQSALRKAMGRSSLLVLPSVQDGFGMVVPQAMACGRPCIVSTMAGASEIIEDGRNGWTFASGMSEELADRLAWMRDHRTDSEEMGRNGMAMVKGQGGWGAYGSALAGLLGRLTSVVRAR